MAPLNRSCNPANPIVDARITSGIAAGSRVNAIIPPLALDGPSLSIRKFMTTMLTMDNLLAKGSISEPAAAFLEAAVQARLNILISGGGTGSGKTTLLNILANFIPDGERIVTIENSAELTIRKSHVVRLETKLATPDFPKEFSARDLVRNALRMRPNRIVVGECRGGEALDMLQAMNTGHDGCLTTIHANSPQALLSRLETLVLLAGFDLPIGAIRQQIADAVQLIVQADRMVDDSRKVTSITEVQGCQSGEIQLADIFRFQQTGFAGRTILGRMEWTGVTPLCLDRFRRRLPGLSTDRMFDPTSRKGND